MTADLATRLRTAAREAVKLQANRGLSLDPVKIRRFAIRFARSDRPMEELQQALSEDGALLSRRAA